MVNETKTLTLSQFLRDRLRASEKVAHNIHAEDCDSIPRPGCNGPFPCDCGMPEFLREDIMSKRAIVDLHTGYHDCPELRTGTYPDDWPETATWGKAGESWQHPSSEYFEEGEPCPTLRLLAAPYRRHEEFREEWT